MRPSPTLAKAKHAEIAKRYKRPPRKKASIAALRVRDLRQLFSHRYGYVLTEDDAGRDDARLMAHHIFALSGNPIRRLEAWISIWAPWMPFGEVKALISEAATSPQRWGADKLAWRLHLTDNERSDLGITTIGAIDVSKSQRAERRIVRARARAAERRRKKGMKPRSEYLANTVGKPWISAGMSRTAWYRQRSVNK